MAGTNWSKVERLKLEMRVGVATRLMDRVAYGEIREWLRGEGVPEEALPSDRSMHGYTETLEYACVMQQRLDSHPELAGRSEPNPEAMGLEPTGGALSPAGFVASARRWLTVRLMVSEQTYKVYDHAAMMADRFEERLLMELESTCWERETLAEELARGTAERGAGTSVGGAEANKEKAVWAEAKGMERHLLEAASKLPELPELDPEDLQREAFWMARRNRLEGDPRLLKPALFSRLVGQMLRMLKEARTAVAGPGPMGPGGGGGARGKSGMATEGTGGTQRGGGLGHAGARPAASVMSGAGATGVSAQPAGLRADSAGFGAVRGVVSGSREVGEGTDSAGLCADSAGFGSARGGVPGAKSGMATEGTKGTQRGGAAGGAAQPAGFRADSAAFGASTSGGTGTGGSHAETQTRNGGKGGGTDSAGLCADSAAFGSAQGGVPGAKSGMATEGTRGTQRGGAAGGAAQPAGFRADSAAFGASTSGGTGTGGSHAETQTRNGGKGGGTDSAGLCADSAAFGEPERAGEAIEYPAYAVGFYAAARADGKGSLLDVAPAVIDRLRREGLTPEEAVCRVRIDRNRAGVAGFGGAAMGLDHLESARKTGMG